MTTPDDMNYAPGYYDRLGNPIPLTIWGELHRNRDYVVLAQDPMVVKGVPVLVSTVWLGIDHAFGGGTPVIFETMVFGPKPREIFGERYHTEEEALEGHGVALRKLCALEEGHD